MENKITVFYYIKDEYIDQLKKVSANITENKTMNRPYIGVVIQSSVHNYFVPMMSPKPKHIEMRNTLDFMKIKNGKLGALNFNNMIPVSQENAILLEIEDVKDALYKNLLLEQRNWILSNEDRIVSKAKNLYDKFKNNRLPQNIRSRCVDFIAIENFLNQKKDLKRENASAVIKLNKPTGKGIER